MSQSKARLQADLVGLRREADEAHRLVVRLLRCLHRISEDNPDLVLPDDLSGIGESYWRYV